MSEWFAGIEGSAGARELALALALLATVSHAVLGALQKVRHDPCLSRGIEVAYSTMVLRKAWGASQR